MLDPNMHLLDDVFSQMPGNKVPFSTFGTSFAARLQCISGTGKCQNMEEFFFPPDSCAQLLSYDGARSLMP